MEITDFTLNHVEQALEIAKANYEEERQHVPILPSVATLPDLKIFAENNLGVSAFENGKMIGFLCCYTPWNNHFGTTNVLGVFSPIHAHGSIVNKRAKIYSKLYQAAAKKWVEHGVLSHAIALYAHDKVAKESFFYNGFGIRCIDAISLLDDINLVIDTNCEYLELASKDIFKILDLKNHLITHLGNSPIFAPSGYFTEEQLIKTISRRNSRVFIAKKNDEIIAYIEIMSEGENFACNNSSMKNICGAYCYPEFRGTGIFNNLLSYLVSTLKAENYLRIGVDFESFNPTALGFWLKYFTEYTNSVVRRIDDKILERSI